MTLQTFTPPVSPSVGLTEEPEIKVSVAQFGDGYSQATPGSLNNIRSVRNATWEVLDTAQRDAILAFFKAQRGCDPFWYQFHRDAAPLKWTVAKWRQQALGGDYHRVEAEFRQSFNLAS